MLITSFGSHGSRVCASFAVVGTVLQSLFSTLLQLDVRIQGLLWGCALCGASLKFPPHSRWFASLSTILSSWCSVSESANPWCGEHGGETGDVSSGLDASLDIQECEYEGVLFRWRMILSWWLCWLAKSSCGSLRLVGRTPKQQCEDAFPDLVGQSEAELNKRLWAGLGELLRSVTSSTPSCASRGGCARGQQTQSQRHPHGQKNRRAKSKDEHDNSLVGGLQRLVERMSKSTVGGEPWCGSSR